MIVRRYTVYVCDACIKLKPSECHTPGCIFFLCNMTEVEEMLNQMMIRPNADGKQVFSDSEALSMGTFVCEE